MDLGEEGRVENVEIVDPAGDIFDFEGVEGVVLGEVQGEGCGWENDGVGAVVGEEGGV